MPLDIVKDIGSSLESRRVAVPVHAFPFEYLETALGHGWNSLYLPSNDDNVIRFPLNLEFP